MQRAQQELCGTKLARSGIILNHQATIDELTILNRADPHQPPPTGGWTLRHESSAQLLIDQILDRGERPRHLDGKLLAISRNELGANELDGAQKSFLREEFLRALQDSPSLS